MQARFKFKYKFNHNHSDMKRNVHVEEISEHARNRCDIVPVDRSYNGFDLERKSLSPLPQAADCWHIGSEQTSNSTSDLLITVNNSQSSRARITASFTVYIKFKSMSEALYGIFLVFVWKLQKR